MIDDARVLGVIPARGGSKGVPGKNIRDLGGKPLIAWTIEAASASTCLDRVILSSDDQAIIDVAREHGCDVPFVRSADLASDTALTIDVVIDALDRCSGYDWVVTLQPTSPLRAAADIDLAVEQCVRGGAPSCVSVCRVSKSPYWMFTLGERGVMKPLISEPGETRRQDLPDVYVLNGAIYVARVDWLRDGRRFVTPDTVAYVMAEERSVDIDTEADFAYVEYMLGDKKNVPISETP